MSVIFVACGSYGGRLPGAKRTARLDSIPVEILRAWSGPCRTKGPSLAFLPSSPLVAAAVLNVLIEPAPDLFKLGPTARNAAHQRGFFMSRDVARAASSAGSAASDGFSSDEDLPGHSNMWSLLLEAAYHHSIGAMLALSTCHSSKAALSQSCHFAVFRSSTDEFRARAHGASGELAAQA